MAEGNVPVGYGRLGPADVATDFDVTAFQIRQVLGRISTAKLVKIIKSSNNGEVAEAGTVNVQPLVNQVDGNGQQREHGVINNLRYVRMQGGNGAIIDDPKAGDIGIIIAMDRDSSAAIQSKNKANPGSNRRFSTADGVYLGSVRADAPKNYVQFHANYVDICFNNGLKVRITETQIILGNPDKPLFNVTTSGGDSTCVVASLEA